MNGIKWLIAEIYNDALSVTSSQLLPWVYTWGIHPDDKEKYQGEAIECFKQGARAVFTSPDGEVTLSYWDCVCNICRTAECNLLQLFMQGIESYSDCDLLCQYAVFGEIKYPLAGEEAHHDVQAA